ncbi:UDP-glycosyltransferase 92A1-like [Salvia miltiorrhiza]|uniref:UDP-glycosyltransferase 92A1-like n=1 Tax=Salvia miltiorrhiza TaxID=226208 RepID=UPI0025AC96B2|nr:UDP-glycosyltransferase 92A1-like [Salvia miltiorrhiza]
MQQHIVMLPFMAQGHLIPFLALANQIAQRFPFTITIATTPLNVRYLRTAASTSNPRIHFSDLPFNAADHGLPPDTENTEALPLHLVINLFRASTSLEAAFRALIRDITARDGAPPLCIISDVFMAWANEVARSSATVNVAFTTGGAYGTAAYMSMWQHLPHRCAAADGSFAVPGFPNSRRFHVSQMHRFLRDADGSDPWSRFFQPQIAQSLCSFGWLCATAAEIEPLGLDVFSNYTKRPIWCVGPLISQGMLDRKPSRVIGKHAGREPGISPEKCLEWLDSHPENSVVYVSFGSQNTISQSQMMALALGLEDSRRPFIWAIRPPAGFNSRDEFKPEWLPDGFEQRKQGLVVKSWAPQLEILCHRSTGAFLSHCGWNSVAESLSQGVPIIGWPLAAEQGYNAKMLVEEMGVCVEMTRGLESSISREDVKRVIEEVIGGESKAEEMRKKAAEIGELIRAALTEEGERKGSSLKAIDDFVAALLSLRDNVHC